MQTNARAKLARLESVKLICARYSWLHAQLLELLLHLANQRPHLAMRIIAAQSHRRPRGANHRAAARKSRLDRSVILAHAGAASANKARVQTEGITFLPPRGVTRTVTIVERSAIGTREAAGADLLRRARIGVTRTSPMSMQHPDAARTSDVSPSPFLVALARHARAGTTSESALQHTRTAKHQRNSPIQVSTRPRWTSTLTPRTTQPSTWTWIAQRTQRRGLSATRRGRGGITCSRWCASEKPRRRPGKKLRVARRGGNEKGTKRAMRSRSERGTEARRVGRRESGIWARLDRLHDALCSVGFAIHARRNTCFEAQKCVTSSD